MTRRLEPGESLELACSVAAEAGRMLVARADEARVVEVKSSPTDIVTQLDRAAEGLIRERILARRPDDAILGEEGGETGGGAPVRWIVDPLDGTVNFLYGLPDWAVSVAAEVEGSVVAGAICAPARGAMYWAIAGAGARRGGLTGPGGASESLACTRGADLSRALVATGFGYEEERRRVQGEVLAAILPRVRDIRRSGSCAIDLCALAAGNVDAYYERGVNQWDFAAGSLIAREAGATVAGLCGRPAGPSMLLAAGPGLFAGLHDLLAGLDPERDEPGPARGSDGLNLSDLA